MVKERYGNVFMKLSNMGTWSRRHTIKENRDALGRHVLFHSLLLEEIFGMFIDGLYESLFFSRVVIAACPDEVE